MLPKNFSNVLSVRIYNTNTISNIKVELFNPLAQAGYIRRDIDFYKTRQAYGRFSFGALNNVVTAQPYNVYGVNGEFISMGNIAIAPFDYTYIDCDQVPYLSLMEYLKANELMINKIRLTADNNPQLIAPFKIMQRDVRGNIQSDIIEPLSFISPSQVQPDIIDIPIGRKFNGYTGIEYDVNVISTQIKMDFHLG